MMHFTNARETFEMTTEGVPSGPSRAIGVSTHVAHGYREIRVDLYWMVIFVSIAGAPTVATARQQ